MPVVICGVDTQFLLDTGAAVTILSRRVFSKIHQQLTLNDHLVPLHLQSASGSSVKLYGVCDIDLILDNKKYPWTVHIADIAEDGYLGFDFLGHYNFSFSIKRGLNLHRHKVPVVTKFINSVTQPDKSFTCIRTLYEETLKTSGLNEEEQEKLWFSLQRNKDLFSTSSLDVGRTSIIKHEIPTGDARPIKIPPRRPPRAFENEVDDVIAAQLEAGIIRESKSPWSAPLHFIRKKNNEVRVVCDYRELNKVTQKDSFPLPRCNELIEAMASAKYFCSLDLQSAYYQIEVEEKDKAKTAFSTLNGHYEYNVTPMGLTGAPATFQRCMETVFKGLNYRTLVVFIDDICIFGETFQQCLERFEEAMSRLRQAGLKLKPEKCVLFKPETIFLGYVVSGEGVKTDPEKVEAIVQFPKPQNVSALRSFLGMASYYRRWIKGHSTIAAPLNRLLEGRKNKTLDWNEECELAFSKLKQCLVSSDIMAQPQNDGGSFIIDCDASATAIGFIRMHSFPDAVVES